MMLPVNLYYYIHLSQLYCSTKVQICPTEIPSKRFKFTTLTFSKHRYSNVYMRLGIRFILYNNKIVHTCSLGHRFIISTDIPQTYQYSLINYTKAEQSYLTSYRATTGTIVIARLIIATFSPTFTVVFKYIFYFPALLFCAKTKKKYETSSCGRHKTI